MKNYTGIIILWAIIVVFSAQRFLAELAFITIPFTLIYLILCAYFLFFKKKPLKEISIKLLIIALSYSIIAVFHVVRFKDARENADLIVVKIHAFKAVHGRYPLNSLEIGLTDKALRKQRIFYQNTSNDPELFYPATQVPFDTYFFNFKKSEWEYLAD